MKDGYPLRVVPAIELHADALIEQSEIDADLSGGVATPDQAATPNGGTKNNRNIVDDPSSQKLTFEEIDALKETSVGSGRDIINKILDSHETLDQKTAFSLAKYTLRKNKKYLKRFCILPLDTWILAEWMLNERDAVKIMELRNETIGLITSWANLHHDGSDPILCPDAHNSPGRWLVVDDTAGLLTGAVAERLGILHPPSTMDDNTPSTNQVQPDDAAASDEENSNFNTHQKRPNHQVPQMSATSNSITVVHSNSHANLSLLKFFGYDTNEPSPSHPLYTHLKTLSWLQVVDPEADPAYHEPPFTSPTDLSAWKTSKRSAYYRKRRRWERTKSVVDNTRSGGFSGLIVASATSPISILHRLVPLLAGGAPVVVYSPHVEPLAELADCYSTARRSAFLLSTPSPGEPEREIPCPDFPVDPTLLIAATVQTQRIRRWQVLPGRTHPLMMGRGASEGYVFHAIRVVPAEGKISARGNMQKRRKVDSRNGNVTEAVADGAATATATATAATVTAETHAGGEDKDIEVPADGEVEVGEQMDIIEEHNTA